MSNEKVTQATIPGWSGPFFPEVLEKIQKRYGYKLVRFNDMLFDDVADQLHDGRVTNHPSTRDVESQLDSPWSHAVYFTRHNRRCQVLFPLATDSSRQGGTSATRHVAMYFSGEAPDEREINNIAKEFTDAFMHSYHELYGQK